MVGNEFAKHIPLTPATFQILVTLAAGPTHGYGIRHQVEARTGGAMVLGAGTLYTGLKRMQKEGLICETEAPSDLFEEASSRWRFYATTRFGLEVLAAETNRLEADARIGRIVLSGEVSR